MQLMRICRNDDYISKNFLGVFPCDKLPIVNQTPTTFIANTKPSHDKGEHWIAIEFTNNGEAFYFCSYGREPNGIFKRYLDKYEWMTSTTRLQGLLSSTCGQYAVLFLYCKARRMENRDFFDLFTDNYVENDEIVNVFVNSMYDENACVFDFDVLCHQVSK